MVMPDYHSRSVTRYICYRVKYQNLYILLKTFGGCQDCNSLVILKGFKRNIPCRVVIFVKIVAGVAGPGVTEFEEDQRYENEVEELYGVSSSNP